MFTKMSDFLEEWKYENERTIKLFKALTDQSLQHPVIPGGRDIGYISWHIIGGIADIGNKCGFEMASPDEYAKNPYSVEIIIDKYKKNSDSFVENIKKNWNDDMLSEEFQFYRDKYKRGFILKMLIEHEKHHRSQLTVLMRQAGLKVPGLYGPSKEEWSEFGMKVQP